AGETRVERFTVIVDDGRGGRASQDVTVTITGTNDAPTITGGSVAGGVTELATPVGSLTSGGSISFADLDLRDGHSVTAMAQGSVLGTLSPRIVTDTTGSGASGSLGWAYAVEGGKVEYLAAGE
ncbi:VCBS domain-containing protein, partial [Methylobacterium segetis]|uniref:VCBS domain-containing protein n=1 Tax=Methylobacterium segetis TaxID=2488750 RepID=UPI00104D759F